MIQTYGFEPKLRVEYILCETPDCGRCDAELCKADAGQIELLEELRVRIPGYGILVIKRGFRWDGASIPRFFWRATYHPLHHRIIIASLVHDALYASEIFERSEADNIFKLILEKWGVPWWDRNKMWLAVRTFGGSVWKTHTEESIKTARKFVSFVDEVA